VPTFRRRASVIDADRVDGPPEGPGKPADAADALALAEEAEAEAAEAEALAAAARARARAIRLRRQAQEAEGEASADVEAAAEVETNADAPEVASPDAPQRDTETSDVVAAPASPVDAANSDTEAIKKDIAEEPAEAEPAGKRRRWRAGRILKTLAAAIAIACTAALITLSVLMILDHRHQEADQQRRAQYAAAARQSVVTLMSMDFNKAKEDVQRIIDNSTGSFKEDFKNQADDFIKVTQESKVVTEVNVNTTAVESMSDDSAVVLVSASSRVTNAAGAKQEPRSWRLSVDVKRDGDQLKMSKVEFVP
jgi:Mce-associated membrane protein